MSVPTSYEDAQILALKNRVAEARQTLHAHLSATQLGALELVCGCSDCISAEDYRRLTSNPPNTFSREDVGRYFGGAGVLDAPRTPEARSEALAIFLHVMDALGEAALAPRDEEGVYERTHGFVEPSYWLEPLYNTDFIECLKPELAATLSEFLTDLAELCVARNHARLPDVLIYLSRATQGFQTVLSDFMHGPPRRRLAFWVAVAGWTPNSPAGLKNNGVSDFQREFEFMEESDRFNLENALADPETGAVLERYAFAARDPDWLAYLSRLVSWRENTVSRNQYNRLHPRPR